MITILYWLTSANAVTYGALSLTGETLNDRTRHSDALRSPQGPRSCSGGGPASRPVQPLQGKPVEKVTRRGGAATWRGAVSGAAGETL
ncbi:hypothetical protein OCEANICA350_12387 [Oceanicaulis sp. 350]|nr:hypothetical protein OCEANICA350_12387 [Oceanicaulis sp. 350]